jgi:hypothetical protein
MTSTALSMGQPDYLAQHVRRVDVVAAIAEPPKAWTALRKRWDLFTDFHARPIQEQLVAAVVEGDGDLAMLRAFAAAEAASSRGDVVIAVRGETYSRLIELYSEVADTNYAKVGKEFDATATEFTAAAKQCDPEAAGDAIVGQPHPVRTAWLDVAKHAAELDRMVPVLCAAAELAGISTTGDTMLLPLLIDPTGWHRRRTWEAWKATGERTGHWGALVALGARIRACPLDEFEPYREPRPLVRKQFPRGGPDSRGLYRVEVTDPEDEDYTPPEAEEPKQRRRAQLTR